MNKTPPKHAAHDGRKTSIAIIGATSHIAKGLIDKFSRNNGVQLFLFARRTEPVHAFLKEIARKGKKAPLVFKGFNKFSGRTYDVIINCVGLGTVSNEPHIYTSFFTVTEKFDNLVISYLQKFSRTLYINFSSGAVYGRGFPRPASKDSVNALQVNRLTKDDCFSIAKINSEAKHRAFESLHIVDIRVFSYFSRFADIRGNYFMTELLFSLVNNKVFTTGDAPFVRDYIHPEDLFALVNKCIRLKTINAAFDAYSLRPVEKKDILKYFASRYNLKYSIIKSKRFHNVTGLKSNYYTRFKNAQTIAYRPRFTSFDTIREETKHLLQRSFPTRPRRGRS